MIKHLGAMARLAGLFHDIGKISAGFQRKLQTSNAPGVKSIHGADPIKHELMGVLIVQEWMRITFGKSFSDLTDREWLTVMADERAFVTSLRKAFPKQKLVDAKQLESVIYGKNDFCIDGLRVPENLTSGLFVRGCCRYALLFLILSHHRLPENKFKHKSTLHPLLAEEFINQDVKLQKKVWSTLPSGGCHLWDDLNSHWVSSVSSAAQDLLATLDEVVAPMSSSQAAGEAYVSGVVHVARTALILADFDVSARKGESPEAAWDHSAVGWANTKFDQAPGQPLDYHLVRVGDLAERYIYTLNEPGKKLKRSMPVIDSEEVGQKFQWQIKAQNLLAQMPTDEGMMVFLMAGTGSGKTIAAARMMKCVSPEGMRFTVALGLRTLTLQVFESYMRDVGFAGNEAALIMGSDVEKKIFSNQKSHFEGGDHHGLGSDYEHVVVGQRSVSRLQEKLEIMKETPVVVATIDSIIDCAVSNKNSGLISMVRMINSDLILDEVDSYSESDLVSVAKLVYLSGFYGRKVVVSSATTTPEIANLMYLAYQTGYAAGAVLRGVKAKVNVAWISEEYSSNRVLSDANCADFEVEHTKYVRALNECLQAKKQKRMAALLDISHERTLEASFKRVKERCMRLSEEHFEVDPVTGKKFSFGLARFSTIENCKDFSMYLLNDPDFAGAELKICTYHSQQMVGFQHLYEEYYNKVLNRKEVGGEPAIFRDSIIRKVMDTTTKKRVVVIMISSPIEEVGRDHDFDWAIVEPTSLRAIIQTAGRVLRHRESSPSSPNLYLLSRPLRAIKYPGDPAFAYPGPETFSSLFTSFTQYTSMMVDMSVLSQGVSSSECILPEDCIESELSKRERKVQNHFFKDKEKSLLSAEGYLLTPSLRFGGSHNEEFKFRGNNTSVSYSIMPDNVWKIAIDGKEAVGEFSQCVHVFNSASELWLYVPTNVEVDQRYRAVFSSLSDSQYHALMYVFSVQDYGPKDKNSGSKVSVPKVAFSVQIGAYIPSRKNRVESSV